METPSSTRKITRSQTLATSNNKNSSISNSETGFSKSRQRSGKHQDRTALIDVTNDSPIIGLAAGNPETPLSYVIKRTSSRANNAPGSGEAILRSQVKTLLQKVEEEAELSKISLESRPFLHIKNCINSPMGILAPTPANTPQIFNLHENGNVNHSISFGSVTPSPIVEEQLITKVESDNFDGVNLESEKSLLTRSLLLDFSDKSEVSDSSKCSSVLTYQGGRTGCNEKPTSEDDDASIWSIQVNASTHDDEEEEVVDREEVEEEDDEMDEEEHDGEDERLVDELCAGISKISMNGNEMVKFEGKHTRFVYNSDDELVEEQVCAQDENEAVDCVSPNILRLKGLPIPQGKHLRFHLEDEE